MASKPERPTAERWEELILSAHRYKETYGHSKDWHTYRQYYRGEFEGWGRDVYDYLPSNETFGLARSVVPRVYFRNPYIMVSQRQPQGQGKEIWAKIVEGMDNWLIQEMNLKQTLKTCILDEFFTSRGIVKVGYDSEFGFNMQTPAGEQEVKGEYNVNVKTGMPWVERVDPELYFVPYGTRVGTNMEWADHMVIKQTEDAKRSPLYKNMSDLEGTHLDMALLSHEKQQLYQEMEREATWVAIHEIRDARRKEIVAVVLPDKRIIRGPEEDVLQIEGLPFVDFTFNEDVEYYWGPSTARIIEPQQLEINEARTQLMLHRRIDLKKFLFDGNRITDDEIDKFMSEDVGPGIKVKGPPREVALELQPSMPPDLAAYTDLIRGDMRAAVGMGRQQMAELAGGRKTATESQIVQQAHDIRMDEKKDVMADTLTTVMRKVNQIVFSFWDQERVTEVVGFDGARYWVAYTPQAIKGEYDLKVDVESMTPTTKALRRKDLVQIIQALSQNPNANLDYLMRMLAREFDWLDAMQVLPQAPEMQNGQPMGMREFQGVQEKLLTDPGFRKERVQQTAGALGGVEGLLRR